MNLYFVVNARMPSKKAYGIHVAKMSEAFIDAGMEVTLIVPRTGRREPLKDFYGLSYDVPVKQIPTIDWYDRGRIGFLVSSILFTLGAVLYLRGKHGVVYTTDMDTFSFAALPLSGLPVWSEMHDWRGNTPQARYFFKHAQGIVTTNGATAARLTDAFHLETLLVEPNGVALEQYQTLPSKEAARARLGLPAEGRIALYLGRFYAWKGLDILVDGAQKAPHILWYAVGGTKEEFIRESGRGDLPENLIVAGESAFEQVPVWLAASDVLLITGTKGNEQSYRHTSPMKVYEYMAAERPIVAAHTPALTSFIASELVSWYEPDDADSLVDALMSAPAAPHPAARAEAQAHTWRSRAARIAAAISGTV